MLNNKQEKVSYPYHNSWPIINNPVMHMYV